MNNAQLEEKIYQQINLIQLKDLNVLTVEKSRKNWIKNLKKC